MNSRDLGREWREEEKKKSHKMLALPLHYPGCLTLMKVNEESSNAKTSLNSNN